MEFNVVRVEVLQIGNYMADRVRRILQRKDPQPTSYAKMAEFIPGFLDQATGAKELFASIQSLRRIVDPVFYPGPKWISFKAISILATEKYLESFSQAVKTLYVKTVRLDNEASLQFAIPFFINFLNAMFKCTNAKPAAVEHLSNMAKLGCYSLTLGLRTRSVK
ncbi:unnamed protein product [Ambrosiozyma monospora]|uniref:Unnamed protein product n=1 Tax=Ambrosiozyma monospora TaxID=43982 RepID=A0ACB5U3U8_AMBMO|nr:unnamed protein product [Ambrosiozyma monospora]